MCRITGFIDFNISKAYELEAVICAMRDTMTAGGPDDAGIYTEKEKGLAFGHRRLSILDLSPNGHQPMCNDDGSLWITYNGEVYNFAEIREELIRSGYKFNSRSDSEVILKAYEHWGIDSVHKLRGMWAFAIWDKRNGRLVLCRDRVGVKPLYWYYNDGLFMFASELKAFHEHPRFHKELDMSALSLYFQYGYITSPYSIFKYTCKLEPGHYLILDRNSDITNEKYWDAEKYFIRGCQDREQWLQRSDNEISDELEEILTESFKLRMVSDVPVGMFLSGGIDSSLVTSLLQKEHSTPLKTFTIGFHERKFDEAVWAKKVASHLGTDHTELYCTPKEAFDIIPKLPELYDEPFGDSSAIPTFLVSRLARQHVKVSLSADAGDELFCGYPKYWLLGNRLRRIDAVPFSNVLSNCLDLVSPNIIAGIYEKTRFMFPQWPNFKDKYIKLRHVLKQSDEISRIDMADKFYLQDELEDLGLKEIKSQTYKISRAALDLKSKLMLFDMKTSLVDDMLVKVDRATMGNGLEGRDPFLDNRIVEYSSQMPIEFKYRNNSSKYILRNILYKYIPRNLIDRPKQGFGIPVYDWLRNDLKPFFINYLNEGRVRREGIFKPAAIKRLLDDCLQNRGVSAHKLWFLLMFQMWRERWLQ